MSCHAIQTSSQLISISHRPLIDSLLLHDQDSLIYILKSVMLGSHRLHAMIDVRRLVTKPLNSRAWKGCWRTILLKLKLVSSFRLIKNTKWVTENLLKYLCAKIIGIEWALTKLLQQ